MSSAVILDDLNHVTMDNSGDTSFTLIMSMCKFQVSFINVFEILAS